VKQERLSLTERMQRIRKTDTKPEMIVRRLIHGLGHRYRLHQSNLPGSPDIVLTRYRKVILVHGCFWHRHDCADGRKLPRSKPEYWRPKLERNRRRDETIVAGEQLLANRRGPRIECAGRRFGRGQRQLIEMQRRQLGGDPILGVCLVASFPHA
jgi:DNA mismatch endonuclease, patch repair protein